MQVIKVKLTDPDPSYHIGAGNPAVGSGWECIGYVTQIDANDEVWLEDDEGFPSDVIEYLIGIIHGLEKCDEDTSIHVFWEGTETNNQYKPGELTVEGYKVIPNRCKSIW